MGLRIKPNCRADFDPAEFSVVCGNDSTAWLLGGNPDREVSPSAVYANVRIPMSKTPSDHRAALNTFACRRRRSGCPTSAMRPPRSGRGG